MGLLGAIGSILGVKDADDIEINKEDLQFLAQLFNETNRTNSQGLFGGWEWDGNTQRQTIDDSIRPAFDQFLGRVNAGPQGYGGAGQFGPLLQATMAQRAAGRPHMERAPRSPPQFTRPEFDHEFEGPPPDILAELRKRYG